MTLLGTRQKAAGAGAPPAPAAPLSALAKFVARGEDVQLPMLGAARVEIVGARESQEIEGAVIRALDQLGIERNFVTSDRYELERALRTLAIAVRDPADRTKPYGTLEEWGALDTDVIVPCWAVYGDVRERLNPLATPLTDEERVQLESAFKKKDDRLLRSFGIAKVCAWLLSSDVQLSTSPTPSSSTPESSSDP